MFKEFVDQLKLYKEVLAVVAALVTGALFIANYFATKDALEDARTKLDALIAQRECELNSRITVAETTAAISWLEREFVDVTKDRGEMNEVVLPKATPALKPLLKQRVDLLENNLRKIGKDISAQQELRAEARRVIDKKECAAKASAQKDKK